MRSCARPPSRGILLREATRPFAISTITAALAVSNRGETRPRWMGIAMCTGSSLGGFEPERQVACPEGPAGRGGGGGLSGVGVAAGEGAGTARIDAMCTSRTELDCSDAICKLRWQSS
jgi:hypothetical protein